MAVLLFAQIDPELALAETRTLRTSGYPGLPDDEFGLLEAYCVDPKCDCRRVMLNVTSRREVEQGKADFVASIGYGFDRNEEAAGPMLDPLNRQSLYARALLKVVEEVLADPAYVARLKRHYRLAKKAASDPDPAVRERVARILAEVEAMRGGGSPAGNGAKAESRKPTRSSAKPGAGDPAGESGEMVPGAMRPVYEAVVAATDAFCREQLSEEYAQMSRKLAATLARKRPSPLAQGKPLVWACGIVYALGTVNFLWDKTQTPHMTAGELCERFGVGKRAGSARARIIMDMFGMFQMDPRWCLPSRVDRNPLVWMLSVDGVLVDIRYAPRDVQEEALRKGLIPYLPGTKE